jgi:outer membrane lipoprotein-sorting protein
MRFNPLKKLLIKTGILLSLPVLLSAHFPEELTAREIINNMFSSIEDIQSLKFKLKKKERVEGDLKLGEQDVKFNRSPKKIYTKVIAPNKGVEVLWVEGLNNKKAYVNPNGFPYMTVSLDPYGSSMRNNNHHTVHEVGFDYISSIVKQISQKSSKDFTKIFLYKGDTLFNNKDCYKILIDYTPYEYINYTVKAGENVTDIAYKLFISDYMVLEINEDEVDDYEDVEAGQVIKIPNAYARKTILYIDKKNNLPVIQKMYDEKGLFAQYEFHNLQLNPVITPEEFTKEYKDYNF